MLFVKRPSIRRFDLVMLDDLVLFITPILKSLVILAI